MYRSISGRGRHLPEALLQSLACRQVLPCTGQHHCAHFHQQFNNSIAERSAIIVDEKYVYNLPYTTSTWCSGIVHGKTRPDCPQWPQWRGLSVMLIFCTRLGAHTPLRMHAHHIQEVFQVRASRAEFAYTLLVVVACACVRRAVRCQESIRRRRHTFCTPDNSKCGADTQIHYKNAFKLCSLCLSFMFTFAYFVDVIAPRFKINPMRWFRCSNVFLIKTTWSLCCPHTCLIIDCWSWRRQRRDMAACLQCS